ncbi:sarcalumenin isoform X2 [Cimex lectularius]|nr:sarcalumenin isoform X2 [Cimex lectularius]
MGDAAGESLEEVSEEPVDPNLDEPSVEKGDASVEETQDLKEQPETPTTEEETENKKTDEVTEEHEEGTDSVMAEESNEEEQDKTEETLSQDEQVESLENMDEQTKDSAEETSTQEEENLEENMPDVPLESEENATKESVEEGFAEAESVEEVMKEDAVETASSVESVETVEEEKVVEPSVISESAAETKLSEEVSSETAEQAMEEALKEEPSEQVETSEETVHDQPAEGFLDEPTEALPKADEETNEPQNTSTLLEEAKSEAETEGEKSTEPETPEEELTMEIEVPENLRSREHMAQILQLDIDTAETERQLSKIADNTLRELKKLYDAAIKPLEILYKYRDLSNRHFGDPEIFSKPLVLFMGPWSGGKSTIINYLLENEYKRTALRTGAEPSPAYFNIVMWGEREEVLDGTQLAADWTFSGLQKFGQGLLDRLRGLKLNHPLLEKVNIVEIPGILEIRKQVERLFPFNDACQWFIDRADIIFLVYDPSKLDVGPESEAILDQLKGREMQTRIILNKADQVRPEELMRVQGTLIWNISPLMSSTEPPVMYSTSLWSLPYESGAPTKLLYAQERAFLRDLREAINKRVENKIASARRFAVRVRNHAKMVDCYLTTYYNHKSFFGNKKKISDEIIEHPQNYHIYEGLSTLTNISRYDLPDPDVYRDFFRLNPVYEFQQLSATCTYFRGCPINRLDIAIAYDLPELVGKYKKQVEDLTKRNK